MSNLTTEDLSNIMSIMLQALIEIKQTQGIVCRNFETCVHPACKSSYTSWAIADNALQKVKEIHNRRK